MFGSRAGVHRFLFDTRKSVNLFIVVENDASGAEYRFFDVPDGRVMPC